MSTTVRLFQSSVRTFAPNFPREMSSTDPPAAHLLRTLVHKRLAAAADEIFGIVEKTIGEYQHEIERSKEEIVELKREIDQLKLLKPVVELRKADVFHAVPPLQQENDSTTSRTRSEAVQSPSLDKPDSPDPTRIKEEQEDVDFKQVSEEGISSIHGNTVPSQPEPCSDSSPAVSPHSKSGAVMEQDDYTHVWYNRSDLRLNTSCQSHRVGGSSELDQALKSCRFCGSQFGRDSDLLRHIDQMHSGEKPFTCPQCDKRFAYKHHLTSHLRVHTGERPHSCPFCAKTFSQSSNLNVHVRVHTGEKPFFCRKCERMVAYKSHLKKCRFPS